MSTTSGTEFAASLPARNGVERESAIVDAIGSGLQLPTIWQEVHSEFGEHRCTAFVSSDALRIGHAEDALRVNVTAASAQRIADRLGTILPTPRICDLVWQQARVRLSPCVQMADSHMADTDRMVRHSREVDEKLRRRCGLVENVGKHWVLSNRLAGHSSKAANYGWFRADGTPIQPLATAHNGLHVDYSQVARLLRRDVIVDGSVMDIEQVGRDPELAGLVSSEGPLLVWRQPGVREASTERRASTTAPERSLGDQGTLKRGDNGEEVASWQRTLMKDGYDLSPWNDDGDFGRVTHNATVSWQSERGLPPNGVVDAATRSAIGTDPTPRAEPALGTEFKFVQARNFTWANRKRVDHIVIHTMEAAEASTTAENVAAWAAGPDAPRASWHYAIDDDSIVQCVKEEHVAWAAPGANRSGIQLEHAGYARQTAEGWSDPFSSRMLALSARLCAQICCRWQIPVALVDAAGLLRGERGITTHWEVTKGPGRGRTTHTDPGEYFPMDRYLELVRHAG